MSYEQAFWDSYSDDELVKIYTSDDYLDAYKKKALEEYRDRIIKRTINRIRSQKI
tara:strand:- start:45 stop:209 length:165 start_codon:yes stop_codon:yes gene_type:complete